MGPKLNFLGSRAPKGNPGVLAEASPLLVLPLSFLPGLRPLLFVSITMFLLLGGWRPRLPSSPYKIRFHWPYEKKLRLPFRHVLEETSISSEEGEYEVDALVLALFVAIDITTIVFTTFIDTSQTLAIKAAFVSVIGLIGVAGLSFFGLLMNQNHVEIITLRKGVNYIAVGIGVLGATVLIVLQYAVFFFAGSFGTLSAVATIQVDPATATLFYMSSAVNETFALQGALYTILVYIFSGFDEPGVGSHLAANIIVTVAAGIMHFGVYGGNATDLVAVASGFFILNLLYELTESLTVPMVAHIVLNLLAVGSGSIFSPGSVFTLASTAPGFALIAGLGALVAVLLCLAVARLSRRGGTRT